jgi:hypothetical protein
MDPHSFITGSGSASTRCGFETLALDFSQEKDFPRRNFIYRYIQDNSAAVLPNFIQIFCQTSQKSNSFDKSETLGQIL